MLRFNKGVIGDGANKISYQKNPSRAGVTTNMHYPRHIFVSWTVSSADHTMELRFVNFGNRVRMT